MELVSVIMSTYRERPEWLREAIESVLNQTYHDIQFIVIVDDPTNIVLREIIEEYSHRDSRIEVIVNEQNLGLVGALNAGLKYCNGQYILRMDADDVCALERIETQIKYVKKYGCDLIGTSISFIDEEGNSLFGRSERMHSSFHTVAATLRFQNCVYHSTWLVKRELYERLNGYRRISFCEDYDFLLRALESGAKIMNTKEDLVFVRYTFGNSISRNNKVNQRCIADYLAKNYNTVSQLDEEFINTYPFSKEGKHKAIQLKKYYVITQRAIDAKSNGRKITYLFLIIKCILFTSYGKKKAIDSFKEKILYLSENRYSTE